MSKMDACPHCGTPPEAIEELGVGLVGWVPSCPCYPHPPLCPTCQEPLKGGRCDTMDCGIFGCLVPVPDEDPFWQAERVDL